MYGPTYACTYLLSTPSNLQEAVQLDYHFLFPLIQAPTYAFGIALSR